MTPNQLSRAALEGACTEVIRRGRWKAGLWIAQVDGRSLFIKDVRHSNPVYRWLFGRWLIWHEAHTYRQMGDQDFVPRLIGRIDGDAFAVERIDGTNLGKCPISLRTAELFDRIERSVGDLHRIGVVHLDLRSRRNICITRDGKPMLIDFGNALFFGRGWIAQRLLVPTLAWIDDSAIRKFRFRDLASTNGRPRKTSDVIRRIVWPWPRLWRAMGVNRSLKTTAVAGGDRSGSPFQDSAPAEQNR